MTLANQYSIAVRHQRSTRIDSDLSADFFPGLVYHGTAQTALETLIRQYSQAGQKAFTLTGPYGSGKSTIALLLTGLLHQDEIIRKAAYGVLNGESLALVDTTLPVVKGWLQIRSVGGVGSPVDTLWAATIEALAEHPATSCLYKKYKAKHPENEAELIQYWEVVFKDIKTFVDGVLLIADEMGKTLEFINKNKGELHLFQDLAEVLTRIDTPVIFLGLLHQSFSEYAKERGTKLQEEWGKIQGRYTDILYNVSTDETVALIAQSIVPVNPNEDIDSTAVERVLAAIDDADNRKNQLRERLKQTAPLHPLVALLLGPISKRRFSQNERSTFGFLNSYEQNSFQMFLRSTVDKSTRYSLHNLWDYLETNLEYSILGSPDGHAWAEASEVINRVDVSDVTLNILKAIALINLFGKPAKLYATNGLIKAAAGLDSEKELEEHLNILQTSSAIVFRKHQSAWVIFEGSDLDIAALLAKKLEQLSTDSTEAIANISFSHQIMAKAHYHLQGSMRWCEQSIVQRLDLVDFSSYQNPKGGEFGYFVLLLQSPSYDELDKLTAKIPNVALAVANNAEDIVTYAKELYALQLLKADKEIGPEIQHDRVALKEYESRLSDAQKMLFLSIEDGFAKSSWSVRGHTYERSIPLSEHASDLADAIYSSCPRILNELVNRNKISGTAVAARKKLLEAMLDYENEENLGMTGFPPEKSMYVSCLKNSQLHTFNGKDWEWSTERVSTELKQLFTSTTELLKGRSGLKVNLGELEQVWSSKPFGISSGVFPILLFAYLKSLGQDIAYYEKAMSGDFEFIAEPDIDYVHKLQKSPKELAIKFVVLEETDRDWLQFLSVFASELSSQPVSPNLLAVATPLVTTIHNLPAWVKSANNLVPENGQMNKAVLRLRDTFLQANDPHDLLISQIVGIIDPDSTLSFAEKINVLESHISVMTSAHEKMLEKMHVRVLQFFPDKGEQLIEMCQLVESKSSDIRLKSFARDLSQSQEFGVKWLESLIAVVIGRGLQNWTENALLSAEQKISEFAQNFLRVVKSSSLGEQTPLTAGSRNISLIWENASGEMETYSKEIIFNENLDKQAHKANVSQQLAELSEFEKIEILKEMLQDALQAQG
jgi:energy-coupling factor transporter ATP-binding protein EcfA2